MAKIYISSTFADLVDYRAAVYRILCMLGHRVIAMEDYVATDQRPLDKCLADVASCDLYVGLVAQRYGYIPDQNNPDGESITQLEYRQASRSGIPRLIFLLDDQVRWPKKWKDADTSEGGKRVRDFRGELERSSVVGHFKNKDHLAALVSVAVQAKAPRKTNAESAFSKIKQKTLESQMQVLLEQYEAVAEQLILELDAADRVKLEKRFRVIEGQIEDVQAKLKVFND